MIVMNNVKMIFLFLCMLQYIDEEPKRENTRLNFFIMTFISLVQQVFIRLIPNCNIDRNKNSESAKMIRKMNLS